MQDKSAEIGMTVRVTGRVQGVAYRAWLCDRAQASQVRGWVRNESDGTVSALLVGAENAVTALIAEMERGPGAAEVEEVLAEPAEIFEPQTGFNVVQ